MRSRYPADGRLTYVRVSYLISGVTYVIGVDSSTQSTKALLVDASDGTVVAQASAPHPDGTSVDPRAWLAAYDAAIAGLGPEAARAEAIAVGGQQHGMVALDEDGEPVRDALLWNDTRSAEAARQLIAEHGGPQACAEAIGSVLVASFTITKLRWLRDHEPENAARVRRVLLPHDYVSLHVAAPGTAPFTDRGDASGTGYFSAADNAYRPDLLELAFGRSDVVLPRVAEPGKHGQRLVAHGPDPRQDGVRVGPSVRQRHVDRVQHGQERRGHPRPLGGPLLYQVAGLPLADVVEIGHRTPPPVLVVDPRLPAVGRIRRRRLPGRLRGGGRGRVVGVDTAPARGVAQLALGSLIRWWDAHRCPLGQLRALVSCGRTRRRSRPRPQTPRRPRCRCGPRPGWPAAR